MTKRTFPTTYGTQGCALVPIDIALVPIVAHQLRELEEPRSWRDEDYETAYAAIAALEGCLTALCVADLVESNNRIYRLLDSTLNGTVYTEISPGVVSPAIGLLPTPEGDRRSPGLVDDTNHVRQVLELELHNQEVPDYTADPTTKQILQGIYDKIAAEGTDISSILTDLETVLVLLG